MTQPGLTPQQLKRLGEARAKMQAEAKTYQNDPTRRRFEPKPLASVLQAVLVEKGLGRKLG
ncbi:MAG: hypothetical protein ACKO85_00715, partial [Isosphaeraceae bacterium]